MRANINCVTIPMSRRYLYRSGFLNFVSFKSSFGACPLMERFDFQKNQGCHELVFWRDIILYHKWLELFFVVLGLMLGCFSFLACWCYQPALFVRSLNISFNLLSNFEECFELKHYLRVVSGFRVIPD